MKFKVAVTNVTNNIGAKIVNYLDYMNFPYKEVVALGPSHELGKKISFGEDKILTIQSFDSYELAELDIIFLPYIEDENLSRYRNKALEAGVIVIDLSNESAFQSSVPSLIPAINDHDFLLNYQDQKLISMPAALSSQLAFILKPLDMEYDIKRVIVSTYQAVSTNGEKKAMDELYSQTKAVYMNETIDSVHLPRNISFNVIPQVGEVKNNIFEEEERIAADLRKLIKKDLNIIVNTSLVPVFIGNSFYVNIEFNKEFELEDLKKSLSEMQEIALLDRNITDYLTPSEIAGEDNIFISKIKRDDTVKSGINMWSCCDNLNRGSAMTAVEIAQFLASNIQPKE